MRIFTLLPTFLLLMSSLAGQTVRGNGKLSTVTHAIDEFAGLTINGAFEVELTQGQGYGLQVITDENLQDFVEVEVKDGTLTIGTRQELSAPSSLKLLIRSDIFAALELNGAINLSSTTPLFGKRLTLTLNGASAVEVALAYEKVETVITGAASLVLAGEVGTISHDISGAGSIQAFDLLADTVRVDIGGAGAAQVHARQRLQANLSGMGSITYRGAPEVTQNISGLGSLRRVD